jgi:3,4-dihydroxy 2-butanone 4-phosphate synthase/GTP cyclohydrolase II
MEIIGAEGAGLIVLINRPMLNNLSKGIEFKDRIRAGETPPLEELRDYGVGAQILAELGVHDMILLSNHQFSLIALDGYDLSVVGLRSFDQ